MPDACPFARILCALAVFALALSGALAAAAPAQPEGPYTDRDTAARQPTMQELGLSGHMDLAPLRERADAKPKNWRLQALVGQMEHLAGNRAAAEERYQRAVDAAGKRSEKLRHVLWSRGWARLYSGDNEGARLDWLDAAHLHGGKPEWLPSTLALSYWREGQRALGMQWFDVSELAKSPLGAQGLGSSDLPQIARMLLSDIFLVRDLRANPSVQRIDNGLPYTAPAYLFAPPPRYPTFALRAGKQGNSLLDACIDAEGHAIDVRVHSSSGHRALDGAALEAVSKWQIRPAMCDGKPYATVIRIPIQFRITNNPRSLPEDRSLFDRLADPDIGIGSDGYTAVRRVCETVPQCGPGSASPGT